MSKILEVWWSPVAVAWRVEDQELFTYYGLSLVVAHLREENAAALVTQSPHSDKTAALVRALQTAGIAIEYSEAAS